MIEIKGFCLIYLLFVGWEILCCLFIVYLSYYLFVLYFLLVGYVVYYWSVLFDVLFIVYVLIFIDSRIGMFWFFMDYVVMRLDVGY